MLGGPGLEPLRISRVQEFIVGTQLSFPCVTIDIEDASLIPS